uniref:Uncharacterized protein n=1 Tax=Nelumbo nucifera TaxID=4432 RepID=A0A822YRB6_NELNU|nr:TPA_asm: hypothetical protein HUJ06_004741 [Nelumbo nucifera]
MILTFLCQLISYSYGSKNAFSIILLLEFEIDDRKRQYIGLTGSAVLELCMAIVVLLSFTVPRCIWAYQYYQIFPSWLF